MKTIKTIIKAVKSIFIDVEKNLVYVDEEAYVNIKLVNKTWVINNTPFQKLKDFKELAIKCSIKGIKGTYYKIPSVPELEFPLAKECGVSEDTMKYIANLNDLEKMNIQNYFVQHQDVIENEYKEQAVKSFGYTVDTTTDVDSILQHIKTVYETALQKECDYYSFIKVEFTQEELQIRSIILGLLNYHYYKAQKLKQEQDKKQQETKQSSNKKTDFLSCFKPEVRKMLKGDNNHENKNK